MFEFNVILSTARFCSLQTNHSRFGASLSFELSNSFTCCRSMLVFVVVYLTDESTTKGTIRSTRFFRLPALLRFLWIHCRPHRLPLHPFCFHPTPFRIVRHFNLLCGFFFSPSLMSFCQLIPFSISLHLHLFTLLNRFVRCSLHLLCSFIDFEHRIFKSWLFIPTFSLYSFVLPLSSPLSSFANFHFAFGQKHHLAILHLSHCILMLVWSCVYESSHTHIYTVFSFSLFHLWPFIFFSLWLFIRLAGVTTFNTHRFSKPFFLNCPAFCTASTVVLQTTFL